ncbi:hypothetical protein GCM10010191_86390 [Actinomadura vinacea]|uniref:DUF4132 domain-containing protein n=2 Tax=Actinomadura vinacea TaxID=115336 RepID=A0ABP5XF41_9ACTN
MAAGRRWSVPEFRAFVLGHPLLWHFARRLVWVSEHDGARAAFRIAEDRTLADAADAVFTPPDGALVGIVHPVALGERATKEWARVFADYEILQPFPQLGRPVHALTAAERGGRLERFEGVTVPGGSLLGLVRRGWERGVTQGGGVVAQVWRRLPDGARITVELDPGLAHGHPRPQRLARVRFDGGTSEEPDPVAVSEALADLATLVETAV